MSGKGPLVSVIVPVYNVAPYVDEARLERWRREIAEAGRSAPASDCGLSVRAACAMALKRPGLYRLAYPVYRAAKQARLRALGR